MHLSIRVAPGLLLRLGALCLAGSLFAGGGTAPGGEPAIQLHVNYTGFAVTVSPVDEESKNADASTIYQRRLGESEWVEVSEAEKNELADGTVTFTAPVEVDDDGVYYFTSRPVVGGAVASPPDADSPPQAVVVVDTLPPAAQFLSPPEDAVLPVAEPTVIAWQAVDEHLVEDSATLVYSNDGGQSWHTIATDLPALGEMEWRPPADISDNLVLRLTVADQAGNIGRAVQRATLVARTEPKTSPAEPAKVAATVPAEIVEAPPADKTQLRDYNKSWLYYLMAVNLMRQNKPKDALQYYWLSVREDPDFINAWADIALAYIDVGAYKTARDVVEQTLDKAPDLIDLMHLLGETYHAEGMEKLTSARTTEERLEAKALVEQAVDWYGQALEAAADEWALAERAPSYYRLGEICYYVNMDRDGARAYWRKILDLHAPTPNPDLVLWTAPDKRDIARERHQRYTYNRVALETWQNWARGYLEQLDERERKGILDLMPAQRISTASRQLGLDSYGDGCDPYDETSLFNLPPQFGSGSNAPAGAGAFDPALNRPSREKQPYSFFAPKDRTKTAGEQPVQRRRASSSMFSGGPDQPPPPNPDPYAFPQRGRQQPGWNSAGPYGDAPVSDW